LSEYTDWKKDLHLSLQHENDFLREIQQKVAACMANNNDVRGLNVTADSIGQRTLLQQKSCPIGLTGSYGRIIFPTSQKDITQAKRKTEEESVETDQESYIRTDDEEGGNTDWEDRRTRWVNR